MFGDVAVELCVSSGICSLLIEFSVGFVLFVDWLQQQRLCTRSFCLQLVG